jgi:hypothetical protein
MQEEILIGPGMVYWILLWPEDGRMMKEDICRIYEVTARRSKQKE